MRLVVTLSSLIAFTLSLSAVMASPPKATPGKTKTAPKAVTTEIDPFKPKGKVVEKGTSGKTVKPAKGKTAPKAVTTEIDPFKPKVKPKTKPKSGR